MFLTTCEFRPYAYGPDCMDFLEMFLGVMRTFDIHGGERTKDVD